MENKNKKCSTKNHEEIAAFIYCQECRIYICKKCEKIHSELFYNHHTYNLDRDIKDIFTGFCKEENHLEKLQFFCKTHNTLCCSSCIIKIKRKGKGQHTDCNVCNIEDIKEEKKNKLKDNIKYLEDISKILKDLINDLSKEFEKINENKEVLKIKIQKIFTKLRNALNDREEELLLEIDKKFDNLFIEENIIKESEKLPNKVKMSLEKVEIIENKWDNDNELNSLINDCVNIENNIKEINIIKKKAQKSKSNNIKINFEPEDEGINIFLEKIKTFGKVLDNKSFYFSFKECPINVSDGRKYIVSGEKRNIITKIGKDGVCMGTICENQLENNKEHIWIIKILKTKQYKIDVGVAPIDFDISSSTYTSCGYYLYLYDLSLDSNTSKGGKKQILNLSKVKDEIKIVMNMNKKTLKFIINNEDKGESFTDIPIDVPLSPAIFLENKDDSIEIIKCEK